jgi:protein involved in polysaccharide export with SLBB domain
MRLGAQIRESGISLSQPTYATPANFIVAKPGELSMQVNVWGLVNHPGRYEVSITTDLVQLVSYAGGPQADAKLDAVKITRFLKTESGISKAEIVVNLEDLYRTNEASLILQPGDTIFMDHSNWTTIRDVISLVTTAAVVTATVASVVSVIQSRRTNP